jgi:hypothetical protein
MAHLTSTVALLYQSVTPRNKTGGFLYNVFSESKGNSNAYIWDLRHNKSYLRAAPDLYSLFSNGAIATCAPIFAGHRKPIMVVGDNVRSTLNAHVKPFYNSLIIDPSDIVETIQWRVGDNTWEDTDDISQVSFFADEYGTMPAQIRIITKDEEVFYSIEKYVIVSASESGFVEIFLTSPTDNFQSQPLFSIGGFTSNTVLARSSKIVEANGVSPFQSEIELDDVLCLPDSGYLSIGSEIISYNHKTLSHPYKIKGCIRGLYGTQPQTHRKDTYVRVVKPGNLFNNVSNDEIVNGEESEKVDYRCVAVKNISDLPLENMSMYFPLEPNNPFERVQVAVEKSISGDTAFSQEIIDSKSEPYVSTNDCVVPVDFQITLFDTKGKLDNNLVNGGMSAVNFISANESEDSSISSSSGDEIGDFGILVKDGSPQISGIDTDGSYLFLENDSNSGEVIYRFYRKLESNGSVDLFDPFTIGDIDCNISVKSGTLVETSVRYADSEEDITDADWQLFDTYEVAIESSDSKNIDVKTSIIDLRVRMRRENSNLSSPSIGNIIYSFFDGAYSTFIDAGIVDGEVKEFNNRSVFLNGNHYVNNNKEFFVGYPSDTESHHKPLFRNDNYVIQSTYAYDVGSSSLPLKFNHALAHSFVPKQDTTMRELVLLEKRIDWDNSTHSEIELYLNAMIFDADPELGGRVIGQSSQSLTLTSKVTRASNRTFDFDGITLKKGHTYWFYVYANSDPNVNGEWRFRGTDNLLYGNPDNNTIKLFNLNNVNVPTEVIDNYGLGFTIIGVADDLITGLYDRDSTIYYYLQPENIEGDFWDFNSIEIDFNNPYYRRARLGPFIKVAWKKDDETRWHRFRPGNVSKADGIQEFSTSTKYRRIPKDRFVMVRVEIDKIVDSSEVDDVKGVGEVGYGAQSALNTIKASWSQFLTDPTDIDNYVSRWIDLPTSADDPLVLSDVSSLWADNLAIGEQFFLWFKRDYVDVVEDIPDTGFSVVINHDFYNLNNDSEYDSSQWGRIEEDVVPLPPAQVIVADFSATGTYLVEWTPVGNALIYQLEEENSPFRTIATTDDTKFYVTNRTDGTYRYRVCAINGIGKSSCTVSNYITVRIGDYDGQSTSSFPDIIQTIVVIDAGDLDANGEYTFDGFEQTGGGSRPRYKKEGGSGLDYYVVFDFQDGRWEIVTEDQYTPGGKSIL